MLGAIAKKFFGSANDRFIKSLQGTVNQINSLEESIARLSDNELKSKTLEFRNKLSSGTTLEAILAEAFAVVREASKRTLSMRHFDVQLIGGIVLHRGMIAEMKTGEGKTLVATLSVYLNALSGKGVHVVTVNDYLAKRDAEWMGKIYNFLGLSVGCIVHELDDNGRRAAYNADITYGTNNEFGFDYLRDNMKFSLEEMVQRPFNYAIVDEVDSILIDEARTPLIISGAVEDNTELYHKIDKLVKHVKPEHYEKDEKSRNVVFNDEGIKFLEKELMQSGLMKSSTSLYDMENISLVHHTNQSLRAHTLFSKDVDYIIKDNRVVLIDEFTGRMMEGRRFSEGLHQALEAKEDVKVQNENQTLASITFQNYFRMFPKLAGMTGTAMTEAAEFEDIYKLQVTEIPTHMPVTRIDEEDVIYRTAKEKYNAIIALIEDCYKRGQPVLVGTVSIEKSEYLSGLLKKKKIPHQVLNARYHEQEASIIAQAGKPGTVTIATNMAGRGTDIMLGGNPEMIIKSQLDGSVDESQKEAIIAKVQAAKQKVIEAGGLYVVGTERHESRRIDNQLRGRSGRQGDPGHSKFFLSLEDDLMRIFGSEKMDFMLRKMPEGEVLAHRWVTKALEMAQQKVEARNFEIRKTLLKFDDVMNDQRKVIYEQRIELMRALDAKDTITSMKDELIDDTISAYIPPKSYPENWDAEGLTKEVFRIFGLQLPIINWCKEEGIAEEEIAERIRKPVQELFSKKEAMYGSETMRIVEKRLLLITLDELWKDHLHSMDHMRQGINLRAYAQKDPLNEYKREAFGLFQGMLLSLKEVVVTRLAHLEIHSSPESMPQAKPKRYIEGRNDPAFVNRQETERPLTTIRTNKPAANIDPNDPSTWGKVGRNEQCPCKSGKKYKHCHGAII